ncbi:MAG: hypothetical protein ACLRMJ_11670 [Alistipes finegoldii]
MDFGPIRGAAPHLVRGAAVVVIAVAAFFARHFLIDVVPAPRAPA